MREREIGRSRSNSSTELGYKVGPRLRELAPPARGSQEAGFTEPEAHLIAHLCIPKFHSTLDFMCTSLSFFRAAEVSMTPSNTLEWGKWVRLLSCTWKFSYQCPFYQRAELPLIYKWCFSALLEGQEHLVNLKHLEAVDITQIKYQAQFSTFLMT